MDEVNPTKKTRRFMRRLTVYPAKGEADNYEGEYKTEEGVHFYSVQAIINNVQTTNRYPYENIQKIKIVDVPEEES